MLLSNSPKYSLDWYGVFKALNKALFVLLSVGAGIVLTKPELIENILTQHVSTAVVALVMAVLAGLAKQFLTDYSNK